MKEIESLAEDMSRISTIAAAIILSGCGASATSLVDHGPLAQSLRKAESIELYEGLPHEHFDFEIYTQELNTKQTVSFGGFPFYADILELAEDDRTAFSELFSETVSFVPHDLTAVTACGGFHPDYCIVWRVGSDVFYALLCFGCHEVKAAGGDLELHADIRGGAADAFKLVLKSYGKNHPEPRR